MSNGQSALDLVMNIRSILDKRGFNEAKKEMQELGRKAGKDTLKFTNTASLKKSQKDLMGIARPFEQATTKAKALSEQYYQLTGTRLDFKKIGDTKGLQPFNKNIEQTISSTKRAGRVAQETQATWMGFGFAMLFTGMAMQRYAGTIARSALNTFNKMREGINSNASALAVVNVHWELLKYNLGDAINTLVIAFLPAIIDVIDWLSAWISEHPKLSAAILAVFGIGGALAMAAGQLALFWKVGLLPFITKKFPQFT